MEAWLAASWPFVAVLRKSQKGLPPAENGIFPSLIAQEVGVTAHFSRSVLDALEVSFPFSGICHWEFNTVCNGKLIFEGAHFRGMAWEPSEENFTVLISMLRNHTHHKLCMWIPVRGSPVLSFALTALPSKNAKISHYVVLRTSMKIIALRYVVHTGYGTIQVYSGLALFIVSGTIVASMIFF